MSSDALNPDAMAALDAIVERDDPQILGLVLSGSAARGIATRFSDVDVYVVLTEEAAATRSVSRSAAIDEIPCTLAGLERPAPFGTVEWWQRWSFAWARILRDTTGGRLEAAVRRQGTLTIDEQRWIATKGDRLDGFMNLAYRALKADRISDPLARRLDAAELVPWFLDVVFTLAGRVRPYNKYLEWELREHPIDRWPADVVMRLVTRLLDGEAAAVREALDRVGRECRAWDATHGETTLGPMIDGWRDELAPLV